MSDQKIYSKYPLKEEPEKEPFIFDWKILITTIHLHFFKAVKIAFIVLIITFLFTKIFIRNKWEARTLIIRHRKNISLQTESPYLYQQMSLNTVLETLKLRNNLQKIIQTLHLKTKPEKLFKQIKIKKGKKSNVFHILVYNRSPQTAVDIANTSATVFIDSFAPIINSSLQKLVKYYSKQQDSILSKMHALEAEVETFQNENKVVSLESEIPLKLQNLKTIELSLIESTLRTQELIIKIENTKKQITALPIETLLSSTVNSSKQKELKILEETLQKLQEKYTDNNPKVLRLKNEISIMKKTLASNKNNQETPDSLTYSKNTIRESLLLENLRYATELKATKDKAKHYKKEIENINKEFKLLKKSERKYYFLQRKIEICKESLKKIDNRILDAKISLESAAREFEILEKAKTAQYPVRSGRKIISILAALLISGFYLLFTILAETFNFTTKSKFDFKNTLDLPLIGNLPDKDQVSEKVFYTQFQILYNKLKETTDKKNTIFSFSSDIRKTGKTFVIQELMEFFSEHNHKVLHIKPIEAHSSHEKSINNINDHILNKTTNSPLPTKKLNDNYYISYFSIDNSLLKTTITKDTIQAFTNKLSDFDYIFWELPKFSFNIQLTLNIALLSDILIIVTRFKKSRVSSLLKTIKFLNEHNIKKIAGILNYVDKDYLQQNF
jgi:uncharacterized protein involved in exopolysaccharide biosynthesis